MSEIVVGGTRVPLRGIGWSGKVVLFEEGGPEFTPATTRGVKPRAAKVDLVTLHDTAGEGEGRQTYEVLRRKGLAIHFHVGRDTITQYCDPLVWACAHMGPGNSRSVGIEVRNAVFPPGVAPGLFASVKRYLLTGRERLMGRPVVVEEYRGRPRRVLGHFPEQKAAVADLVLALLASIPTVPAGLPRGPGGKIHADRLPADWTGIAGHLHFTDAHVDPALDVFDGLLTVV